MANKSELKRWKKNEKLFVKSVVICDEKDIDLPRADMIMAVDRHEVYDES